MHTQEEQTQQVAMQENYLAIVIMGQVYKNDLQLLTLKQLT